MNMPARRSDYVLLDQSEPLYYPVSEQPEPLYRSGEQKIHDFLDRTSDKALAKGVQTGFVKGPYAQFSYATLDTVYRPSGKSQDEAIERAHAGGIQGIPPPRVDRTLSGFSDKCSHVSSEGNYSSLERSLLGFSDKSDSERCSPPRDHYPSVISHPLWDRDSVPFEKKTAHHIEQNTSKFGARHLDRSFVSDNGNGRNGASSSTSFLTDGGIGRKGALASTSSLNRQTSGESFTDSILSGDVTLPTSPSLSINPSNSTFINSLCEASKQLRSDDDEAEEPSKSWAQQTEQSYNMQLALAIRLMAEAELTSETRLIGHHFKDNTCSAARRSVEATAHRFWVNGSLGYSDVVQDGFYMICGMNPEVWTMCNFPAEGNKMPSLDSLRAVNPSESSVEVILIDKNRDPMLRGLESKAFAIAQEASNQLLAENLGHRVCMLFGGVAASEHGDLMMRWQSSSEQLKECIGTIVLPLGNLSVGLCRHRALLFKMLADTVKLPCRIARGCQYCGSDEGASCIVLCEPDREFYVDLIGKPGSLSSPDCLWSSSSMSFRSPLRFAQNKTSYFEDVRSWCRTFLAEGGFSPVCGRNKGSGDPGQWFPSGTAQLTLSDDTPGAEVWAVMKVSQERVHSVFKDQFNNTRVGGRRVAKTLSSGNMSFVAEVTNDILNPPRAESASDEKCGLTFRKEHSSPTGCRTQSDTVVQDSNEGRILESKNHLGFVNSPAGLEKGVMPKRPEAVAPLDDWEIGWEDILLKEKIGGGSFGTVHRADWHGSDVAVKILIEQDVHEERLKEFLREVAIMKRLRHPNVVLFMGVVSKRPNLSIVTEYLPRGSLFRLLHKSGIRESLDERRRLRMAYDVALGMNYLHRSNPPIVHRDLKSPNLLVDKTWTVKVCDFGLSRFKGNTFLSSRSGAGTPEWMAPEVLRDEQSNEKSDVYSYGVVLWELVTLQQPWSGMSPAQVVGAVGFQNRRLQIPKEVNPEIATLIESCWSNDPRQRPSFASIMQTLKDFQKATLVQPLNGRSSRAAKGE